MRRFWFESEPAIRQLHAQHFPKNLSLAGAALVLVYFGTGKLSLASTPLRINPMKLEIQTLNIFIRRDADEVYRFVSDPENMPKWAKGLCQSIRRAGDAWIAETPGGPMKVRFTEPNAYRVADHYVIPATGAEVQVPLRVLAHEGGSEVVFTLFPQPGMSAEQFQEDARQVRQDLNSLKRLLEEQIR